MPTFIYKARDNRGELKESSILSDSAENAKATLKQEGLWILDIKQIDKKETEQINQGPDITLPFTREKTESPEIVLEKRKNHFLKIFLPNTSQFH